jgi:hypothetical protein
MATSAYRVQFYIPAETVAKFDKMIDWCELDDKDKLVDSALRLFEWAVVAAREGKRIALVDENNQTAQVFDYPELENAARHANSPAKETKRRSIEDTLNSKKVVSAYRINFDIVAERIADFERMMYWCDLDTGHDVLNSAMHLFEWAVSTIRNGHEIASVDLKSDDVTILSYDVLENVAQRRTSSAKEATHQLIADAFSLEKGQVKIADAADAERSSTEGEVGPGQANALARTRGRLKQISPTIDKRRNQESCNTADTPLKSKRNKKKNFKLN